MADNAVVFECFVLFLGVVVVCACFSVYVCKYAASAEVWCSASLVGSQPPSPPPLTQMQALQALDSVTPSALPESLRADLQRVQDMGGLKGMQDSAQQLQVWAFTVLVSSLQLPWSSADMSASATRTPVASG